LWSISSSHGDLRTGSRHRTRLLVETLEERIQPSTVTWTGAGGGDWATVSNWSTGELPGSTDDVVIPTLGTGAAITHSSGNDTVASITSSTNLVLSGGNLTVNGNLQEASGTTFTLKGGNLANAAVTGGVRFVLTGQGGVISQVTIAAGVTMDATQDFGSPHEDYTYVRGGLTLNGTLRLGSAGGSSFAQLIFQGSQTLGGTGSVVYGASTSNALYAYGNGSTLPATLTIGSGVSIQGGNGTVSGYYTVSSTDSIINNGTITVGSGQTLNLGGVNWVNNGSINTNGATVNLGGSFTTAGLGHFNSAGGTVNLIGTLNNAGATLALAPPMGAWHLLGGTINGGTIGSASGSTLALTPSGGILSGVTIAAGTTLDATQNFSSTNPDYAYVTSSMTLNGTLDLGSADGSITGQLDFQGSQALGGSGSVICGGSAGNVLYSVGDGGSNPATLTIGSGIVVQGGNGFVDGYNSADGSVFDGTVNAGTSGQTMTVETGGANDTFLGFTAINVSSGATINVPQSLEVDGPSALNVAAGGFLLIGGDLLGATQNPALFNPQGTIGLFGGGTATTPDLLEAMSADLGSTISGFTNNFAFGTLSLASTTSIELVDQSHNSSGSGAEAVYANSLIVPSGSTLNLNGLHLYVQSSQVAGTIVGGSIITVSSNASTSLSAVAGNGTYAATANLTATLSFKGTPLVGKTVAFTLTSGDNVTSVGSATTNSSGVAILSSVSLAGMNLNAGTFAGAVSASFAGDASDPAASGGGTLTVRPAAATLSLSGLVFTYDGTPHAATVTTNPADLSGVMVSYTQNSVTVTSPTTAGAYTVTAALNNTNYTASTVNGTLTINQATPTVTWANPADITYGTALGTTQLNATVSVPGSFVYAPAAGTVPSAGQGQALSVTFTPIDTTDYSSVTTTATINVRRAMPTITWAAPADITYGTALSATQLDATASVPGTFVYTPAAGTVLSVGQGQTLSATFTPTDSTDYSSVTTTTTINVRSQSQTVTITWANPADITYGTALGATQLNATASVPGTFVYTPAAGTVLGAGQGQTLSSTFTPTDTAHYSLVTTTVSINVRKATPTITWANPADITYGTALGATQLNATASVPGSFVYAPAAGTVLSAGQGQTLSSTFTPTDSTDCSSVTTTVSINVRKAALTITWANPADITYGTALGATQLNATASVPGTFVYTPTAGTVLGVGQGQTLLSTFTPTDTTDYASVTKTATINVCKATPTITWANPADITYGTALSATQLNATASVPGSFVYTPAAGTVLSAGQGQTLSSTFTPTDTADYSSVTTTTTINVRKATPTTTWANPADITYGTALSATQLNATASVLGDFLYTPAAGTVLSAGQGQSLSAAFTPTDINDYSLVTTTAMINVRKATPTIAWANLAEITYGTALGATQLNATASVPGTFAYMPPAGTLLRAGQGQSLAVTFSPTDTRDYTSATAATTIDVGQAAPTITWANPTDISFGTPLGPAQLDATASSNGNPVPGTFTYTPSLGSILNAGTSQVLSVGFMPADTNSFNGATATVLINVAPAPLTVTVNNATKVYGQPNPKFSALYSGFVNGDTPGSLSGSLNFSTSATAVSDVGSYDIDATGLSSNNYTIGYAKATLSITPANQTIAWSNPADITYGTPLSAAQLDATVSVPGPAPAGTLTYAPAAGTLLNAGSGQLLSVVAGATLDYNQATGSVPINVRKATPVVAWTAPANVVYGTPLDSAQLVATASFGGAALAGRFVYSPTSGTVLNAGSGQSVSALFTPSDTTDFYTATVTTTIDVTPAQPVFDTLATPTMTYGISSITLSGHLASANSPLPPGTVAITVDGITESAPIDSSRGTFSAVFPTDALGAASSPYTISYVYAGTSNFAAASATTDLTVDPANQTIHWANPADFVYGAPLGVAQLDATVTGSGPDTAAGALSYSPPTGTILNAGPGQTLTVTAAATPNYKAATAIVTISVRKATPTITWANPADIVAGTPLGPDQLSATASIAGTFAYSPVAGTVLNAGQGQTLSVTFTPSDPANENTVTATTAINVASPPPPLLTAPPPAPTPSPTRAPTPTPTPVTIESILPAATPPVTVLGVQWQTHMVSRTRSVGVLVVSFSGALDPSSAQNLAAYHLFGAGAGSKLGARDRAIALTSARYDPVALTVILTPRGTVAGRGVRLSITAAQVLDSRGRPIDGNRDGQPGGDYTANLYRGGIGLASATVPGGQSPDSPARGRRHHL
jgi:hypothetical protein